MIKRLLILCALSSLLNSCTGLSFALTPEGKVTATYEIPVTADKGGK